MDSAGFALLDQQGNRSVENHTTTGMPVDFDNTRAMDIDGHGTIRA